MKRIMSFVLLIATVFTSIAQTTNPSCYSNAAHWAITKIENKYDGTYVHLNVYTYQNDYQFWINPGMYIERYNENSSKYYIKSFEENELNAKYILTPYKEYDFTLKFERIPDFWTDINILEPPSSEGTSWYWKYISLNKSESERLKTDNFLLHGGLDFLSTFAHPTNRFRGYRYSVDYNSARVTLYYEGYITDLTIHFDAPLVSKISVIYDNDFIAPFSTLSLIRDWILQQDNQEYTSEFEKRLHKAISEMTGNELACLAMTILWNLHK